MNRHKGAEQSAAIVTAQACLNAGCSEQLLDLHWDMATERVGETVREAP